MKIVEKILIACASIFVAIGISVGTYFLVKENTRTKPLTQEEMETILYEDAVKFYNNLKEVEEAKNTYVFKDDTFYCTKYAWEWLDRGYDISFDLNRLFGYNFTLAFSKLPETMVHKNIIEFNDIYLDETINEKIDFYACHSFILYSIYAPQKKITFNLKTQEFYYSDHDFSFKTVENINENYYYNEFIGFGSCKLLTMCYISLYCRSNENISIETAPQVQIIEKPNIRENIIINVEIEIYGSTPIIKYFFEASYIGIYKFSITEKGSNKPFGYAEREHYMMYC